MINVKKIALHFELTFRGSIIIERTDVDSVPDAIVKDGNLYIITDCDCSSVLYRRSKAPLSKFMSLLLDIYPDNTYLIIYV